MTDSVPELLYIDGWDRGRCGESIEECGVFQYVQGHSEDWMIMRFICLHVAITFTNGNPLFEWKYVIV